MPLHFYFKFLLLVFTLILIFVSNYIKWKKQQKLSGESLVRVMFVK